MNNPVVQFVSLMKSAAKLTRLYCQTCGRETPHAYRPAGSWEEYRCTHCGNTQAFKVR